MEERQAAAHHHKARSGVGAAGEDGAAGRAGAAIVLHTRFRPPSQRHRSAHRSAPVAALSVPIDPGPALSLQRAGGKGFAGGRAASADGMAIDTVAALGLSLPSRSAQRHGLAHLRSARSEARGCRSRSGRAHDPVRQVRTLPARASASHHTHRTRRLSAATPTVPRSTPFGFRVRLQPRNTAGWRARSSGLLRAVPTNGPASAWERNGPRLHDFRHRFAVQVLTRWYESGEDPARRLPELSTYLGHVYVAGTYWYLSNSPELMAQAMRRLERRWGEPS